MKKEHEESKLNKNERRKALAECLYSGISNIEKKEHEKKFRILLKRLRNIREKKEISERKPPPSAK